MRKGQALIEYALMLALVLLVSMPAIGSTGRQIPIALDPLVKALGGEQVSPTPGRGATPIVVTVIPPRSTRTPIPSPPRPPIQPTPTEPRIQPTPTEPRVPPTPTKPPYK